MTGLDLDAFTLAAVTQDLTGLHPPEHADAIEFRMDLASDPLDQLAAYNGPLPIIATNRAKWEGGGAQDEGRIAVLREAVAHPAVEMVDIELEATSDSEATKLREDASRNETTVIVSWHDFAATPSREVLTSRLADAAEWGDIGKVAVTAQSVDDVLDLLLVTRNRTHAGDEVATMAMGEVGRHSRIVAPLYGSQIGYAPVEPADATAPGQFPIAQMVDLIGALAAKAE